ncbi:hypothetical protein [Candidatus Odyssella thessalonicensis]|uniref:hypothetical protein n=1 Tax=Candidatus Odyssella thessalonicensis TaxID=84647 RepID=UPI000225B77E|nr:hypothetical protein [Candidatus Odyssella thessalonicensis]
MNQSSASTDPIKELTSALFVIRGLTKELEKERDAIITSTSQMSVCTRQFIGAVKEFEGLSPRVAQQLKANIHESSQLMAKQAAEETVRLVLEKSRDELEKAINRIEQQGHRVNNHMDTIVRRLSWFSKLYILFIILATLAGGVIGGGLVHYFFPPINAVLAEKIQYGEYFHHAWSTLTEKDKEQFMAKVRSSTKKSTPIY